MAFSAAALAFTAVALAMACLWSWTMVAWNSIWSRVPLIPWSPRTPVPWALIDLLAVVGLYLFVMLGAGLAMHQFGWVREDLEDANEVSLGTRQGLIVLNTIGSLLVGVIGFSLVAVRSVATAGDFGISLRDLKSDLRLGFLGFVMLGPPVYALQGLLVYLWKPSTHPLMEMFKESPGTGFFAVLFLSAAVVAPLFEELMFRVLVQGFLEKAVSLRGDAAKVLIGNRSTASPDAVVAEAIANVPDPVESANPYAPPQALINGAQAKTAITQQPELRGFLAWAPIAVSSAVFAILHFSHGPDWIPLFFLAAGMGYMYQRTHRLIPSLTVHSLLNALSMWGLWVQVHSKNFSS